MHAPPPPMPCQAVTWSIDTTGLRHPGRASAAARRAFAQWSEVTGIRFDWQPSGGRIGIVFRAIDSRWLAYTMADAIVIGPAVVRSTAAYMTEVIAHEIGHTLGIPHGGGGLLGGKVTRPTVDDAALVNRCPH